MPIGIEFQVYDPVLITNDVWGPHLTIDEVFSGPTIIRAARQAASFYEAVVQAGVSDWLSDSLTAKSFAAENIDSRFPIRSQRQYLQ